MRVLICGSRTWPEEGQGYTTIAALLKGLYEIHHVGLGTTHLSPFVVIEGGARGADAVAAKWARHDPLHEPIGRIDADWGIPTLLHEQYPAEWAKHGRAAGPIRNARMLAEGKPDVVYAFNHAATLTPGTRNMIERAKQAGIPTFITYWLGITPIGAQP